MSPPTGSLRLVKRHIRERRISRTTFIVTVYLIINVLGRLSVAIFGLAYNMMDKTGIDYPILATNWTSVSWTSDVDTTINQADEEMELDKEATEGKDTTSIILLRCRNGLVLIYLKRIVGFSIEWIARVRQDPRVDY